QRSASEINKAAKKLGASTELSTIASRLETLDKEEAEIAEDLKDSEQQFTNFDEQLADTDRHIAAALQKGDKDKLRRDVEQTRREIQKLDGRIEDAIKDHSALFRAQPLARDLLAPVLAPAFAQLETLRDKGKIPNATIPVLEDRLDAGECICGETL